jgi:Uri superfamily endonuclease
MLSLPGTYALVFSSSAKKNLKIGKLGTLHIKPGYYVYTGSAFGPGGLLARIAHHQKNSSRPHWHIDYLRPFLRPVEIWYTTDPVHREHQWSELLSTTRGASIPLIGFGSSDCCCRSHLYFFSLRRPSGQYMRRKMHAIIGNHDKIFIEKMTT